MATRKPTRDPLKVESAASRRARAQAIETALRGGAQASYLTSIWRRDILVERAMRGLQVDVGVVVAREIEAPIIRAVASILGTRIVPTAAPFQTPGAPPLPPLPSVTPATLAGSLDRIVTTGAGTTFSAIGEAMEELADQETAFVAKAMVRSYGKDALTGPLIEVKPIPGPEPKTGPMVPPAAQQAAAQIVERVKASPMFGAMVEDTWGKALAGLRDRVEKLVGEGLARGDTTEQIVAALRGTRAQKYTDGLLGKWRTSNVNNFVRTVATHTVAQAREGSYAALGVPYVQLIATLDLRTTDQCILLDQTVWPVGEGPRPPIHPGCRTSTAPAFGPEPEARTGKRASKDGPVPATTNARNWFLEQPVADQEFQLGVTRSRLLREGKIEWRQLFGPGLEPLRVMDLRAKGFL